MPALPAVSRVYSARANAPFANNSSPLSMYQSLMFNLKQHMTDLLATGTLGGSRHANSIWTVLGSSNGTTGALDAVDRWTAYTDLANNSSGSAHAWIALQNTTLGYQACLDVNQAGASPTSAGLTFTEIGTPFTGGSNTTRPTATNEFMMGTTSSSPGAQMVVISDQITGNFNWTHYVTTVTGEFYFLASRTGQGWFSTFLSLAKTINNRGSDTRNVFAMGQSINSSPRGSPAYDTITQQALGCVGRNPNGSVCTTGGIQFSGTFGATAYPHAFGIDAVAGTYLAMPCHVMSLASQPTYRGEIPDLYAMGTGTPGASIPTAAAQERILAGDYIIPWPTVNPIF